MGCLLIPGNSPNRLLWYLGLAEREKHDGHSPRNFSRAVVTRRSLSGSITFENSSPQRGRSFRSGPVNQKDDIWAGPPAFQPAN